MLAISGFVILLGGCASTPPLSDFERSLYTYTAEKASLVIYRSTEESWMHKPIPARIHLDGSAFARLLGGEFMRMYLTAGQHVIHVEYYRDCELVIPKAAKTVNLEKGSTYYLEIVPGFGGMTWIFCSPFQLVPFPMVGSAVEMHSADEETALRRMGKAIDEELLKTRKITR